MAQKPIISARVQTWLDIPPVEWAGFLTIVPDLKDASATADELDSLIERAARLCGYLRGREAGGYWSGNHKAGVDKSNRTAKDIRKALGYSYPKQDVFF